MSGIITHGNRMKVVKGECEWVENLCLGIRGLLPPLSPASGDASLVAPWDDWSEHLIETPKLRASVYDWVGIIGCTENHARIAQYFWTELKDHPLFVWMFALRELKEPLVDRRHGQIDVAMPRLISASVNCVFLIHMPDPDIFWEVAPGHYG
ncbi:MAG: hypothetical protein OXE45_04505 [bacterium]|nr:hypothetical protein [bacterium]